MIFVEYDIYIYMCFSSKKLESYWNHHGVITSVLTGCFVEFPFGIPKQHCSIDSGKLTNRHGKSIILMAVY